jgi:hypothetical protein
MNLCVGGELNILLPQTSHNQHQNMNLCVGGELTILLPQTSHNQHQNMNLCVGGELTILLPQTSHNQPQNNQNQKPFLNIKASITTLYSNRNSLQWEVMCVKVTNTYLYTNPKETSQETFKSYPPHN